tara:strand:- start:2012 stop:2482 length:471 start_codon:yes stop_codon:yes gene_type:complete
MGSKPSKHLFDDINELHIEYEHKKITQSKNLKKTTHEQKSTNTRKQKSTNKNVSFTVCVNKNEGVKLHNFIRFNAPTNVTINALKHYNNIGIVKEQVVNVTVDAGQYIKIYDPFNENAFENPIQVGEIAYYGKKADVGYLVSFIDTNFDTFVDTSN